MKKVQGVYRKVGQSLENLALPFSRFSLFLVYFWFGLLKLLGFSPAGSLVYSLYEQTLPFIPFDNFYLSFALLEMVIGIMFLVPRLTRVVFILFICHMATTFLPLIFLPNQVFQKAFVPTLEGQYIIKNLVLISLASLILIDVKKGGEKI